MASSSSSSSNLSSSRSGSFAISQSIEHVGPSVPPHVVGTLTAISPEVLVDEPPSEIVEKVDPEDVRDNQLEIEPKSLFSNLKITIVQFIGDRTAETRDEGPASGSHQVSAPPRPLPN
ncbi:hypothetical protein Salat_2631000 [Sesamum alatum]|uniref:Uncharacterized protein n=1 Tax=Sesamum alatum TaxID=300844 RepID=A0AAE1XNP1_9LAMI|nr:hypothetical protein Salat_2631000 [Sesamum alatum]